MTEQAFLNVYDQYQKVRKQRDHKTFVIWGFIDVFIIITAISVIAFTLTDQTPWHWLCWLGIGIGIFGVLMIIVYFKTKYVNDVDVFKKQMQTQYSVGDVIKQYYQVIAKLNAKLKKGLEIDTDDSAENITKSVEQNQSTKQMNQTIEKQKFEYLLMVSFLWPSRSGYLDD